MTAARPLVLWGATGQARVLCELIDPDRYRIAAFVDRGGAVPPVGGVPVLGDLPALTRWVMERDDRAVLAGAVAIGNVNGNERHDLAAAMTVLGIELVTLVHRTAFVARDARVGVGAQLLAGSYLCARAQVNDLVILNTRVSVDHDTVIGAGSHLAPGVVVAGETTIGRRVFVGAGAVVLPRLTIGDDAVIGAGAVVIRDVPAGQRVAGVPARALRA